MKNYIVFLVILLCSCSNYKGDKDSLDYDKLVIKFDGYSERYKTSEMITVPVTNSNDVAKLNKLKNLSERKWFGNVKGTDYIIELVYFDSESGNKLLIRILKSIDSTPSIEYGSGTMFDGTYKNDELVNFVSEIINLESIGKFSGSLSQSDYDSIKR